MVDGVERKMGGVAYDCLLAYSNLLNPALLSNMTMKWNF